MKMARSCTERSPIGGAVQTSHLFRPLLVQLIELLRSLDRDQWELATSAREWSVKDVAAHMLDVDFRRLSVGRDGHAPPHTSDPITEYEDLLRYLNGLNAEWVRAARRLSPRVLCDYLELTGGEVATLMETVDPMSQAPFAVAWAGQAESPMWLDVGREYTERWHHQDQIRDAVAAHPLRGEQWLRPALEISLLALPHAYRKVSAEKGTCVSLDVSGPAGGEWYLIMDSGWVIRPGRPPNPVVSVRVADLDLMRSLTHRLAEDRVDGAFEIDGAAALVAPLIAARAVMV
jgi:hypothetical protein